MDEHDGDEGSIRRPAPAWRVAVALLAVTTVAAGIGGYWLGERQASEDAPQTVVGLDPDAGEESGAPAAEGDDAVASEPGFASRSASGGGVSDMQAGYPDARPLLARTAADGTLIRVLQAQWAEEGVQAPAEEGGWTPPPQCQARGNLEIGLVTDTYVANGWGELFGEVEGPADVWGAGVTGYPQLGPMLFAAVRTTDAVGTVRLVFDGATVDETAPVDGWAIVAARLPAGDPAAAQPAGEVVVLGRDGDELQRQPTSRVDSPYERADCQPPPPALPNEVRPAGEGDAAAVDGAKAAFQGAFNRRDGEAGDARPFVQSGERLDDAWIEDLREKIAGFGFTDISVVFGAVGFIDDQTALLVFRLDGAPIGWSFGEAVLVEDEWKVASQTWCALVEQAGVTCPSGMRDPNRGPSRYDRYDADPSVAELEARRAAEAEQG